MYTIFKNKGNEVKRLLLLISGLFTLLFITDPDVGILNNLGLPATVMILIVKLGIGFIIIAFMEFIPLIFREIGSPTNGELEDSIDETNIGLSKPLEILKLRAMKTMAYAIIMASVFIGMPI